MGSQMWTLKVFGVCRAVGKGLRDPTPALAGLEVAVSYCG